MFVSYLYLCTTTFLLRFSTLDTDVQVLFGLTAWLVHVVVYPACSILWRCSWLLKDLTFFRYVI